MHHPNTGCQQHTSEKIPSSISSDISQEMKSPTMENQLTNQIKSHVSGFLEEPRKPCATVWKTKHWWLWQLTCKDSSLRAKATGTTVGGALVGMGEPVCITVGRRHSWQKLSSWNSPAQPCPFKPQSPGQSNRTRHELPSPTHPLIYFNYPLSPPPF